MTWVPAAVPSLAQISGGYGACGDAAMNRTSPPADVNDAGEPPSRSWNASRVPWSVPSLVQNSQVQPSLEGGNAGGGKGNRSLSPAAAPWSESALPARSSRGSVPPGVASVRHSRPFQMKKTRPPAGWKPGKAEAGSQGWSVPGSGKVPASLPSLAQTAWVVPSHAVNRTLAPKGKRNEGCELAARVPPSTAMGCVPPGVRSLTHGWRPSVASTPEKTTRPSPRPAASTGSGSAGTSDGARRRVP